MCLAQGKNHILKSSEKSLGDPSDTCLSTSSKKEQTKHIVVSKMSSQSYESCLGPHFSSCVLRNAGSVRYGNVYIKGSLIKYVEGNGVSDFSSWRVTHTWTYSRRTILLKIFTHSMFPKLNWLVELLHQILINIGNTCSLGSGIIWLFIDFPKVLEKYYSEGKKRAFGFGKSVKIKAAVEIFRLNILGKAN